MVTYWSFILNERDFEKYCANLKANCVAKLSYQGVNIPGYINVRERVAYFYNPQGRETIVKRSGFSVLKNDGKLEWKEFSKGNPIPPNALPANPNLKYNRLYFGSLNLPNEVLYGPVLDNGTCHIPINETIGTSTTPDAILVKIAPCMLFDQFLPWLTRRGQRQTQIA
ncbi:Hypothetical predicted protein [Cloeon dipterum]|uniref:Uncharacterized protein n=1 Tax=Cloeon dipterum TaxID=197152 RepID=A0A8S1DSS1_9INSE|nr:Hypothetical predicted protein [Cloeon dipterum]